MVLDLFQDVGLPSTARLGPIAGEAVIHEAERAILFLLLVLVEESHPLVLTLDVFH